MVFKEYTAEEAHNLMPEDLSKKEKRFIMKHIKKAAKRGHYEIALPLNYFNVGTGVLEEYLHKLKYCTYLRPVGGEIDVSWYGAID